MIRRVSMVLALAGMLGLTATTANAGWTNMLTDGSFTAANLTPSAAVVNGANAYGVTSGTLPGSPSWSVADSIASGTPRGVMIASTSSGAAQTYFGSTLPANPLTSGLIGEVSGSQVAYFIGDSETTTLSQSLSLVAGNTYVVGFDAAQPFTSNANTGISTLTALIGGTSVLATTTSSLPNGTSASDNSIWQHFQSTFVATSTGVQTFTFSYVGAAAGQDILLDRVFVANAVPEPGSIALAAIVSGIGGIAYRRNRARKNTAV